MLSPFGFSFDRLRTGLRINSARNPYDDPFESLISETSAIPQ
jgi:hypothetical protein